MNIADANKNSRISRLRLVVWLGIAGALVVGLGPLLPGMVRYAQQVGFHPHAPDIGALAAVSLQIKIHIAAALSAFVIGCIVLLRRKGSGLHKALGWAWALSMGVTAITSFFITGLNGQHFSIIHLISGWTVVALPAALFAIRNKQVMLHRRLMTGLFIGLVVAGALTFLPGRLMYQLFFG